MKKNKILLTTYFGNNYGSLLQAFALTAFLKTNGFDVEIVEEKPFLCSQPLYTLLHLVKIVFMHPIVFFRYLKARRIANKINITNIQIEYFESFRKTRLPIKYISYEKAKKESKRNDVLKCVCGSDQIWNGEVINFKRFYFLSFSKKEKNISYAPSFGRSQIAKYNIKKYTRMINNISIISLREPNDLLKEAKIVCDPTLLLSKNDWNSLLDNKNNCFQGEYILLYLLDSPTQKCIDLIEKIVKSGENVVSIGQSVSLEFDKIVYLSPSVDEFPSLFFRAKKIITDSYHGCIFSIIGEKQFIFVERNYSVGKPQNIRFQTLFKMLNLNMKDCEETNIDYNKISKTLEVFKMDSANYLLEALKNE